MTEIPDPAYCDCVGTLVRRPWFHAETCPRWEPTPRGPGSTTPARERAMAEIRAAITDARRRHQENQP